MRHKMPYPEESPNKQHRSDAEEYEVEEIMGERIVDKRKQYLLKWKDYPRSESSWEWEENLQCPDLLEKFKQKTFKTKYRKQRKRVKNTPLNTNAYVGPCPLGRDNPSTYKGPYQYMYIQLVL